MSHHPPTPPSWEAIQEPADDASSDEEDDDDDESLTSGNKGKHVQHDRARKRKENDEQSQRASPLKRPRHEATTRVDVGRGVSTSISAPGGSRHIRTPSTQAGPSRLPNATSSATNVSAAPRLQPPIVASRPSESSGSSKPAPKPPRPRYKQLLVFNNEFGKEAKGSATTEKTQPRTSQIASSSTVKPSSGANEIIEISSDDSEPRPARSPPAKPQTPAPKSSLVFRARKSTGGGPKPVSKASPEIIVITDSEEERAPQSRLYGLMNEHLPKVQTSGSAPNPPKPTRESESDAAMETDYDAAALPFRDMDVDNAPSSPVPTSPPQTIASPSSKAELQSPSAPQGQSSPDHALSASASPSRSQVKKPIFTRDGMDTIPSPSAHVYATPQRPKHAIQSAVKSASLIRRRESSSPGDEESEDEESDNDGPHEGIDLRNLSDALDIIPRSGTVAEAVPPTAEKRTAALPRRPSALEHFSANTRDNAARKASGGTLSLAEAITVSSLANAPKRRGKEFAKRMPLAAASKESPSEQLVLQKAKDSSKIFSNLLSSRKGKEKASETPSDFASANSPLSRQTGSSMSGVGEPFKTHMQPSPPITSPSPDAHRLQNISTKGLHRSELPLEAASVSDLSVDQRPRSAPALGQIDSLGGSANRPSVSVLQSTTMGSDVARKHIRPPSLSSLSKMPEIFSIASAPPILLSVHSPKPVISETRPRPLGTIFSSPLPSRLPISTPQSPVRNQELGLKSSQSSNSSPAPQSPPAPTRGESSSVTVKYDRQEAHAAASKYAMQTLNQELALLHDPSGAAPAASSDDTMQDAAEVEALFGDDGHFGMDIDDSEGVEPEPVASSSIPSTRESSRRSSQSSTSEHWLYTSEEGEDEGGVNEGKVPSGNVLIPSRKTYGGFQAVTMKDHMSEQKEILRNCRFARDLPYFFQDYVNAMPAYLRSMPAMRHVFEAIMMENTMNDEPDAPPIEVQNDVDAEATPPWEFYYTNEMWHGEGVPRPDIGNLVKCSCKGVCKPKSKTCACLKRQREACHDPNLEFAFDKTGKLQIPGYPIFECNDLCGCGDECRNRVVQHGRKVSVAIRKTANKGWGVFATKKIQAGSFIGIYSGELITDVVAHLRGVNYNKFGRTYLFDIDFHHLKKDNDVEWTNKFTVDAYHAGNFTRFLNHSCDPNSRLFACYINEGNIDKPLLVIFSLRDIEANEEICFNYQGNYPGDDEDGGSGEDDNETGSRSSPQPEGRDLIYERCMCGAKKCTGIMFK